MAAQLGDAFNSREAELVRRIGPDAAGWLSAGRPRREAFRVALRACSRRGAAELVSALADAAGALAAALPCAARCARRRLHLSAGGPADHGRPSAAGLCLSGAARRRAPAARPPRALPQRRRRRRERRVALAARPRATGRAARLRGPRRPHEGCGLAMGHLRRAARDARDRGHAPLPARPGLRDLRESRIRADRAGRQAFTRERADAAEAQPVRPGRDPGTGGPGRRRHLGSARR